MYLRGRHTDDTKFPEILFKTSMYKLQSIWIGVTARCIKTIAKNWYNLILEIYRQASSR